MPIAPAAMLATTTVRVISGRRSITTPPRGRVTSPPSSTNVPTSPAARSLSPLVRVSNVTIQFPAMTLSPNVAPCIAPSR